MKNYPVIFNQNDLKWNSAQLGTLAGATIGAYGCLLSCLAAKACFYGKETDPLKLNDDFKAGNIYVNGDLLPDNALQVIYGDIPYQQSFYYPNYPPTPADLGQLKTLLADDATTVTLCVSVGSGVHFVEAVDCDGENVTIANPWTGNIEPFSRLYGDPKIRITRFIVYKGPVVPQDPMVCDKKSIRDMLVTKATKYDAFVAAGYETPDQVKKDIDEMNTKLVNMPHHSDAEYNDLEGKYTALKAQLEQINGQTATVTPVTINEDTLVEKIVEALKKFFSMKLEW